MSILKTEKNTNDGLSEGKAFQTLNKVNDLTLGAGDRVLLKNGSVFEDQALHIKGSGSENAPIKISTYGMRKTDVLRSIQTVMDNGN